MKRRFWIVAAGAVALAAGCGGDARVELVAADSLEALAAQMELALTEYHAETESADDARESAAVAAFVARIRNDVADEQATSHHADAFAAALAKLRGDRRVEWQRRAAAQDNVAVLREIGRDLRRLAVESLTLQDEARRYILSLIEARRAAQQAAAGQPEGQ